MRNILRMTIALALATAQVGCGDTGNEPDNKKGAGSQSGQESYDHFIGLYAIAYISLTEWSASLYGSWVGFTPEYAGAGYGVWAKVLISGAILIPPTMLMGGTLPAMLRHVTENLNRVGQRVSQFYAINAFGAAGGGLIMAFLLMPTLGMEASLMGLAAMNGVIGLAAYLLSGVKRPAVSPTSETTPAQEEEASGLHLLSSWQVRLGLILIFIAGFFGFCLFRIY